MVSVAINGQANVNQSGGWIDPTPPNPTTIWCWAWLAQGRAAANNARPIIITGIQMFVSGYGGTRNVQLFCSDAWGNHARSPQFQVGAGTGSQNVGWRPISAGWPQADPRDFQVGMYVNGAVRPGKAPAGGRHVFPGTSSYFSNATLAGMYDYTQVASAPGFNQITPSADGKSVYVSIRHPRDNGGDDGGSTVSGFCLQWAWDAGFTQGVGQIISNSGIHNLAPMEPGRRYYYRVAARNTISDWIGAAGGPWSTTHTHVQPVGGGGGTGARKVGKVHNGTGWVDPVAKVHNGTGFVDPILKVHNGTGFVDNP